MFSAGFVVLQLLMSYLLARQLTKAPPPQRISMLVGISGLAAMALIIGYLYPIINEGGFYAGASDRDEALDAAIGALVDGGNPYHATAFVKASSSVVGIGGNPISAMPGEVFLALPFYLLGATHLQNFFWLLAAFLMVCRTTRRSELGLILLLVFLGSPSITAAELLTGGDMLAMSLAIGVCAWQVFRAESPASVYLAATLLGLAIASRPHFFMLLPLLLSSQWIPGNVRNCLPSLWAGLLAAGISAFFYVSDPAAFSPLHAQAWVLQFASILPRPDLFLYGVLLTILATFALATRGRGFRYFAVFGGILMFVPPLFFVLLESTGSGSVTLQKYAWYAIPGWALLSFAVLSYFEVETFHLNNT
jgi:hypothetical protein